MEDDWTGFRFEFHHELGKPSADEDKEKSSEEAKSAEKDEATTEKSYN